MVRLGCVSVPARSQHPISSLDFNGDKATACIDTADIYKESSQCHPPEHSPCYNAFSIATGTISREINDRLGRFLKIHDLFREMCVPRESLLDVVK